MENEQMTYEQALKVFNEIKNLPTAGERQARVHELYEAVVIIVTHDMKGKVSE